MFGINATGAQQCDYNFLLWYIKSHLYNELYKVSALMSRRNHCAHAHFSIFGVGNGWEWNFWAIINNILLMQYFFSFVQSMEFGL